MNRSSKFKSTALFAMLVMIIVGITNSCKKEDPLFTLTLSVNPASYGEVSGAGEYYAVESIDLTATANDGYEFVNWTEDGTELSTSEIFSFVMPNKDVTLVANFQETIVLTLEVNPDGTGEVSGGGSYVIGENVGLSATPNYGYVFVNWTDEDGNVVSSEAEITTTIGQESITLTANFDNEEVTDVDDNVYQTVVIGDQVWMTGNLRTTKYNDGTDIAVEADWSELTTGAFTWYNNDAATYKDPYGALYNWHAVATGNLCPDGWRVPTSDDWIALYDYCGGASVAGVKLKEAGIDHWDDPNTGDNESGFTAISGGLMLGSSMEFSKLGEQSYCWDFDESTDIHGTRNSFVNDRDGAYRKASSKNNAFSVRCIKE